MTAQRSDSKLTPFQIVLVVSLVLGMAISTGTLVWNQSRTDQKACAAYEFTIKNHDLPLRVEMVIKDISKLDTLNDTLIRMQEQLRQIERKLDKMNGSSP